MTRAVSGGRDTGKVTAMTRPGSSAARTLGPDLPTMRLHDSLAQRETKTVACPRAFAPIEPVEDAAELLGRHPRAMVDHPKQNLIVAMTHPDLDRRLRWRVADRVENQVRQHPIEEQVVELNRRRVGVDHDGDRLGIQ